MKKRLIAFALLFITTNALSAKSIYTRVLYMNCAEYADISQGIAIMAGVNYGTSLIVWRASYDGCIAYQLETFKELSEDDIDDGDDPK